MRRSRRGPAVWGIVFAVIMVIASLFFLRQGASSVLRRVNVVVATSPISLWSWDRVDGTFVVISMPEDIEIDAIHGYGKYSLEAIWKLSFIEKKDASILAGSLSDALGIPISWYVGDKQEQLVMAPDVVSYGRAFFTVGHLVHFITGQYHSNMPVWLFSSFTRALGGMRSDRITLIDLSNKSITYQEELPDSTKRNVLDPAVVDVVLKGMLEDEKIRKEGLSVTLLNTTPIPALGSRAARLLATSGVLVVSVGSEESEISECQIEGEKKALASLTAAVIAEILDCHEISSVEPNRTDLVVRIGGAYAKLFEPQSAPKNH